MWHVLASTSTVLASRKPHLPALRSQECLSKFPERSPQHLAAVVRPMDMDHGTLQAIPSLQEPKECQLCLSKSESLCWCDPSWILVVKSPNFVDQPIMWQRELKFCGWNPRFRGPPGPHVSEKRCRIFLGPQDEWFRIEESREKTAESSGFMDFFHVSMGNQWFGALSWAMVVVSMSQWELQPEFPT